ncbi:MAG TPA: hypothetical protein VNO32_13465 [Candidatus Acidoferrum sp.]|nr:hypothetical protein [Candidatus Acidoferrum sp.]
MLFVREDAGFRPLDQIAEALRTISELYSIMPEFSDRLVRAGDFAQPRLDLLCDLYRTVMTMPQDRVDVLLNGLVARLSRTPRGIKTIRIIGPHEPEKHFPKQTVIATGESSRFIC